MDECGIFACSKTKYFSYKPTMNSDRRSTDTMQTIFTLVDSSTTACFTSIKPVHMLNEKILEKKNL